MEEQWIETYTGKKVTPLNMKEEDLNIEDIAHSLALQCRFTGHCRQFYSIAEHSVRVAGVVTKLMLEERIKNATDPLSISVPSDVFVKDDYTTILGGLLHDACEAYIGDTARPIKDTKRIELENTIQGTITQRFLLSGADAALIKKADNIMLATEACCLMRSVEGWNFPEPPLDESSFTPSAPNKAEQLFLARYKELIARRQVQ